ncbi:hypothetical protein ACWIUD_08175 [Helicobacter sp. 23-1044]
MGRFCDFFVRFCESQNLVRKTQNLVCFFVIARKCVALTKQSTREILRN